MCGIAGVLSLTGEPIGGDPLARMAVAQHHRGPDHRGDFVAAPVGLASQRLSILDLAGGNQPIFNEDRSVVVVYNGEIYNFRELREELSARGHRFITASDTEVLVHGYEEFGADILSRLNGMFAFALWDASRRRLMLARDHVGMKPLYYAYNADRFWFASEVKALLAAGAVRAEPNPEALAEFLTFQNLLGGGCFFKDVRKLQPGHYLLVENGRISEHRYWDALAAPNHATLEENLAEYTRLFDRAVNRHLIADVDVGAYLSGGYDSTAVALVAARHRRAPLHTFTGAFSDGAFFDEREPARAVAAKCGATVHELPITARMFWSVLDDVVYALDEPSIGSGAIPQYLVAQQAARVVKVILTGHGGDELLLGYEAYKAARIRDLARTRPQGLASLLPSVTWHEAARLAYFTLARDSVRRAGLVRLFSDRELRSLLAPDMRCRVAGADPLESLRQIAAPVAGASALEQTSYLYFKTYLPTLLVQEDKVGMAHSLESRMPLCDRELIEFLLTVPLEQRMAGGTLKYFPKTALADLYPPTILRQVKRGFPTPIALWFRGELRQDVEQRLFGPQSLAPEVFDRAALRSLWDHFVGARGASLRSYYLANRIYSILTIISWFEGFVAGRHHPARTAAA